MNLVGLAKRSHEKMMRLTDGRIAAKLFTLPLKIFHALGQIKADSARCQFRSGCLWADRRASATCPKFI
jgi:hypothetical protein